MHFYEVCRLSEVVEGVDEGVIRLAGFRCYRGAPVLFRRSVVLGWDTKQQEHLSAVRGLDGAR